METFVTDEAANALTAPSKLLNEMDAASVAEVMAAAADVTLILDGDGVIKEVTLGSDDIPKADFANCVGRRMAEIVTTESQPKVEALLDDAVAKLPPQWRQVNHPSSGGADIPIRYSAIQIGQGGNIIAIGRDESDLAALQQRLVQAQVAMEREYARLKHTETRYKLLFNIASEAVVILNASDLKIVELNPAAAKLLGDTAQKIVGRSLLQKLTPDQTGKIEEYLNSVRLTGRAEETRTRIRGRENDVTLFASLFRQDNIAHFLIRLTPERADSQADVNRDGSADLFKVIDKLPDAFVVTDQQRRIVAANTAFLDLTQLVTPEQTQGERLDRWLGRSEVDLNVLVSNLREHGSVRNFATSLRGEFGTLEEIEVSAVAVTDSDPPCYGFTMRNVGPRPVSNPKADRPLPHSVEQLTGLVGRVPLKDVVRETTDLIEKLCIEAALELTGDNRASAAEMLGLSRQSLYVKLRRYGLGDLETERDD